MRSVTVCALIIILIVTLFLGVLVVGFISLEHMVELAEELRAIGAYRARTEN